MRDAGVRSDVVEGILLGMMAIVVLLGFPVVTIGGLR